MFSLKQLQENFVEQQHNQLAVVFVDVKTTRQPTIGRVCGRCKSFMTVVNLPGSRILQALV